MASSLEELRKLRPVNRENFEAHKKRMLDEVRAYRLAEVRKAMDLTQVQLAQRLNVSQNRVSRLEQGDIDKTQVDTLRRYVEAIGGKLNIEVEFTDQRVRIV